MIAVILNTILAELAAVLTLSHLSVTPLALFAVPLGILLLATPPIGAAFRRPFSFPYFALLIVLSSTAVLKDSEVFSASLDVIYYLGYEELAKYLHTLFSHTGDIDSFSHLLTIIWLYTSSAVVSGVDDVVKKLRENGIICRRCAAAYIAPLVVTSALFLIYPSIISLRVKIEMHPFLAGIAALGIVVLAAILLVKGSEISSEVKAKFREGTE